MASYIRFVILPKNGERWFCMDLEASQFDERILLTLVNAITAIDADKGVLIRAHTENKFINRGICDCMNCYDEITGAVFGNEDFQMWAEEIVRFKESMAGGLFTAGIKKPHEFDSIVKCIPIYVQHISDVQFYKLP
jgi:hypothetical protein